MVKHSGGALLPSLSVDRELPTSISAQLAAALRDLILSGALQPGERLPSSRTLARDQGVSRTTAVNVYDKLTAEGLIESRVGAGAYVSDALEQGGAAVPPVSTRNAAALSGVRPRLAQLSSDASEQYFPRIDHPEKPRSFITGTPAYDAFPVALWARLTARYWRQARSTIMRYPDADGLMDLRKAVASHLRANRGILCSPEEIFIFNGAQDAFNRIGAMLLDPGDTVWFENPGPIGARNSLISAGAKLVPLPIDDEGIDVATGLLKAPDFRLAFVTPAHQHPLGVTMSLRRRFELLRAADQAGAWIVEDDYVGEFHYAGRPVPTLKNVDTSGRVIYVGTFSKTLFPALRLGFVVAPPELVDVFHRIAGATMQGAPTEMQSVVASFIEEGHFAAHIRRMRRIYGERRKALMEAANDHLPGLLTVKATDTGLHAFGELAPHFDENEVSHRAAVLGLLASPVSRFAIGDVKQQGLILGFSGVPPREIDAGVTTLAELLREMNDQEGARPESSAAIPHPPAPRRPPEPQPSLSVR
ncbi:PLP-dependent aminotransferase family protein [Oricola cellulosilytica]|uniref:PLP-dependent aminotransferase family protein n=1 Tax=Oricola cellulosilytica TaxID=1429082 RepID=A0A4V2MP02_9HYPH|nr:PLP-dependent aminotransferase family protein [Oricola cellulosilytica]TCD15407.1 PLP-dependent aminotransferase family protein [Oricola cellulosilytica]